MSCIDLYISSLGQNCDNASNSTSIFNFENISSDIVNSVMSSNIFIENNFISIQNQNVNIDGSCCGQLDITQSGEIKVIDIAKIDIEFSTNIAKQINGKIKEQLTNNKKLINNVLGPNQGGKLFNLITNKLEKITESNSIKQSIIQLFSTTITSQNQNVNIICSQKIPMPTKSGKCVISQSFLLESVINNVIEIIMKDIISDSEINKFLLGLSNKFVKDPSLEFKEQLWYYKYIDYIKLIIFIFVIPVIIRLLYNLTKKRKK
jgi:hypothetical protein